MTTMPTNTATTTATAAVIASEVGVGPHNGREARNLAEKHRRDKLNASIQELATMVPHVADSARRLDKTAVLRFAAHGLRLQYVFGKSVTKKRRGGVCNKQLDHALAHEVQQRPQQLPQLTDTLMQLLDSFFLTLTCHGQIVVISASVEQLLGHCQSDLYGQNILHITHPEDQALLLQKLIPNDMESLFNNECHSHMRASTTVVDDDDDDDDNDILNDSDDPSDVSAEYYRSPSPHTQAHLADIDQRLRLDRRSFTVRLARAGTRSEATRSYEIVKIDGCFRRSDFSASAGNFPIVSQLIRRSRSSNSSVAGGGGVAGLNLMQHDAIAQAALHGISGNDIVLVAMARIIRPPKIINRLLDGNQLEYRTRHLIDGRIIDCDQRIGLVAGYMKDEVRNLCPFSFMHQDDVRWVIVALRQMYDCNSDYGESCYRLLSRNGHFIYLQTKGYLEIDKGTNKVHSFVCVNTLLDEEEGRRKVQEMKNKFSVIIKTKIPTNSLQDVPASQNPQQLERIVLYLIENLQKRHENGATVIDGMGLATTEAITAAAAAAMQTDHIRYTKTPPLALVPPEPSSVKSSITKSVNIVNVTAAKNLPHSSLKSPVSLPNRDVSLSPASSVDQSEQEHTENIVSPVSNTSTNSQSSSCSSSFVVTQRPSVLQMKTQTLPSSVATKSSNNVHYNPSSTTPPLIIQQQPASHTLQQQISVLKRLHATPVAIVDASDEGSTCPAKRSSSTLSNRSNVSSKETSAAEIHTVISSSLQNLDQSLQTINQDAHSLCQQRFQTAPMPHAINQKLDAIFVEHKKQTQILVNIKNEYNVHVQRQQQPQKQQHNNEMLQLQPQINASSSNLVAVANRSDALTLTRDGKPL